MTKINLPCSNCFTQTLDEAGKKVGCPLYDPDAHNPHNYFGDLDKPRFVIIGEAPSKTEQLQGIAFLGREGKLLSTALSKFHLNTERFAMYNVVQCRPTKENQYGKIINKKPSATEKKVCKENLEAFLTHTKPEYIIALGAMAASQLKVTGKISDNHGQFFETPYGKVMPMYGPGYVLRSPNFQEDFEEALAAFREMLDGEYIKPLVTTQPTLVDTPQKLKQWFTEMMSAKTIAIDIETTGLLHYRDHILGVAFSAEEFKPYYIPMLVQEPDLPGSVVDKWIESGAEVTYLEIDDIEFFNFWGQDQPRVIDLMRKVCASPAEKGGQNFKFDYKFLKHRYNITIRNWTFDTMLMHYLIDENRSHSLKYVGGLYFPEMKGYDAILDTYIGKGKKEKKQFGKVPLQILGKYGAYDTDVTLRLKNLFDRHMTAAMKKLHTHFYIPLSKMYFEAELLGVKVDVEHIQPLIEEYNTKRAEALAKVYEIAGEEFNLRSWQKLGKILYEKLHLPVMAKTDSGGNATDEGTLKMIDPGATNYEIIHHILSYRGYDKMLTTYLEPALHRRDELDRVHPSFLLHGTVSGRLSSKGPNIQNIPRDPRIKGSFIPEEDFYFVEIDYSQAELRVMAFYSGDKVMTQKYAAGEDIHMTTAMFAFKKPASQITKRERKLAKLVNFGNLYGGSAKKLQASIEEKLDIEGGEKGITLAEAEWFKQEFFKIYPGIARFIKKAHGIIQKNQKISSCFGRVRRLPMMGSPLEDKQAQALREGLNALIQGTASDLTQLAAIRIRAKYLNPEKVKSRFLFTVHDAIIVEVHKDETYLIPLMKKEMENNPSVFNFPLVGDIDPYCDRWGGTKLVEQDGIFSLPSCDSCGQLNATLTQVPKLDSPEEVRGLCGSCLNKGENHE